MREFNVRIKQDAFDALVHLAVRERRAPREQAAVLLENTLQALTGQQQPDQRRLVGERRAVPA